LEILEEVVHYELISINPMATVAAETKIIPPSTTVATEPIVIRHIDWII